MKKRFLYFIFALTMMVSLLLVCPLAANAEDYTIQFGVPNDYLGVLSYVQFIQNAQSTAVNTENKITAATTTVNTGNKITKATKMNDTGNTVTIDGTEYRVYSVTTATKPNSSTYFKVICNVQTCPDPTLITSNAVSIPFSSLVTDMHATQWYLNGDWQYGENIVYVPLDFGTKYAQDSVQGEVKLVNTTKYTVTFDLNGGVLSTDQIGILTNKSWTLDGVSGQWTKQFMNSTDYSTIISEWNGCNPAKEGGFTFDKWTPETGTLADAKTFTASYAATNNVTFDANGGTGSMATQAFTGSSAQKLSKNAFVREGYKFKGWSEDPSAVSATYTDEQEISAGKAMTLYAVWNPLVKITVTASSATKTYDGTALTCNDYAITSGALISGDALSVTVTGTITNAGSSANVIDTVKVMRGQVDVTDEYDIASIDGVLTVGKADITLTSGSAVKVYDGTPLTNSNIEVSGAVVSGESFSYIVTGSQTEVGSSDNSFGYGAGAMTDLNNYNITTVYGTLTVTEPSPKTGDSIGVAITVAATAVAAFGTALSFRRKKEND